MPFRDIVYLFVCLFVFVFLRLLAVCFVCLFVGPIEANADDDANGINDDDANDDNDVDDDDD